jgi:hypothetical protein
VTAEWSRIARCPGCGQVIYKINGVRIGKRWYGRDCAARVMRHRPQLEVIDGVTELESRRHSFLRARARGVQK